MRARRCLLVLPVAALMLPLVAPAALGAQALGAQAPPRPSAEVVRDEYGVPHVYAQTSRELFYGDGYAQMQDRLWQADLVRRTATGTLSELVGAGAGGGNVQSDAFFRLYTGGQAGLRTRADQLDALSQQAVVAFVDGVNAEIADATRAGTLPVEYGAVRAAPTAWTVRDVVAIGMLSTYSVGTTGADELQNAAVLTDQVRRLGPVRGAQAFSDTHWLDDPSAPTTIPGPPPPAPALELPASSPAQLPPAAADVTALRAAAAAAMGRLGLGGPGHSNVVLLSGHLTTTGHPMLLGGPQIGYSLPQGFVEIGLHGAGYDSTGVVLAGTPGVQIGVGHGHAWTVTTGGDDNQDLYLETVDPVGHPGQYLYAGRWRRYDCRLETIAVAGAAAVPLDACESVHGPVLGGQGDTTAISLRDATRDQVARTLRGFLDIDRATSVQPFLAAARTLGGSLNVWYADADHIAYQRAGRVPLRSAADNRFLPHPGDGSDEWSGFLPADDLPRALDPAQGWLANWNNKPRPGWQNSADDFWQWGPVQRVQALQREVRRIEPGSADRQTLERLNRVAGTTAQTPAGAAHSVTVPALLEPLLQQLRAAQDPRLAPAAALLRGWSQRQLNDDGDGRYDSPAVTVYDAWYDALVARVVVPVLGSSFAVEGPDGDTTANVVARLLQGPAAALPLTAGYLRGTTAPQAVTDALVAALDTLTARFGTADTSRWLTRAASISWSPLGAGSVPVTPYMNRGTYNQIVSLLPHGPSGENVVAPGQSGDLRSPHFADQLALYATWRYKPMRLTRADLAGNTSSRTVLPVPPR